MSCEQPKELRCVGEEDTDPGVGPNTIHFFFHNTVSMPKPAPQVRTTAAKSPCYVCARVCDTRYSDGNGVEFACCVWCIRAELNCDVDLNELVVSGLSPIRET